MRKALVAAGFVCLFAIPAPAFAWGDEGHELVVAIALAFRPNLAPRLSRALRAMPESRQWVTVSQGGWATRNGEPIHPREKENVPAWIASLTTDLPRAGRFPDWIRDYRLSQPYSGHHFINLDFESTDRTEHPAGDHGVNRLLDYERIVRSGNAGDRAWAVAWVLHLVGDLHQPLHATARLLPGSDRRDQGGNLVNYDGGTLHHFWDALPQQDVRDFNGGVTGLAREMVASVGRLNARDRQSFNRFRADLDPWHWVQESRSEIQTIGYPGDHKVANYPAAAHRVAMRRILLAGARLADLLDRTLPR
jgi:hypothetical protein